MFILIYRWKIIDSHLIMIDQDVSDGRLNTEVVGFSGWLIIVAVDL